MKFWQRTTRTTWVGDEDSANLVDMSSGRVIASFTLCFDKWEMCACLPLWRAWAINAGLDLPRVGRFKGLTHRWVFFPPAFSAREAIRFLNLFSDEEPEAWPDEFAANDP
ncbi:MAG: hypothetical protein J7483_08850 [Novosphingobium sp.]|nr:hypothetical protein [Novosphingobium sp.]